MNLCYETNRLKLRTLDESSAELVRDYYLRNKEFLKEWDPVRGEEFYSLSYHYEILKMEEMKRQDGILIRLWLFSKTDEERIIGMVSFNNIVRGAFQSCHLGYNLDENYINKGYITEAIQEGIHIIFNDFKLHRIEANIMPKNIRSRKVCEKLGFREEGLAKEYLKINGKWEDHIHMVLLNDQV
jgi:[ribosomal protein S5]-alanine N-acetyltransferase